MTHDAGFADPGPGRRNRRTRQNRTVLTVAETETLSGDFSADDLDTVAEVAALLPRP
ncbi:hypothetical protein FHU38_002270 [Saccharomonospora amisosensis]|uniref:FXSXX-COOH protein n=1 Tax=Saccharomonospora amisosensis TaxID=1128677 RepID=A0A7X5UPU3_9PSEU|nr:hypothetical protein [Saccharomonospora amisosensis]